MKNNFEKIIENRNDKDTLTVDDQTFLNETILDEYLQCSIFGKIKFFEVDFIKVWKSNQFTEIEEPSNFRNFLESMSSDD